MHLPRVNAFLKCNESGRFQSAPKTIKLHSWEPLVNKFPPCERMFMFLLNGIPTSQTFIRKQVIQLQCSWCRFDRLSWEHSWFWYQYICVFFPIESLSGNSAAWTELWRVSRLKFNLIKDRQHSDSQSNSDTIIQGHLCCPYCVLCAWVRVLACVCVGVCVCMCVFTPLLSNVWTQSDCHSGCMLAPGCEPGPEVSKQLPRFPNSALFNLKVNLYSLLGLLV